MLKIYIVKLEGVKEINATLCRCNRWLPILELIGVPLLEPVTHMPPHVGACYFHSRCLPMLPAKRAGMSAGLWRHHQTNWFVRSAILLLATRTKWHAVGKIYCKVCLDEHNKHFRSCPNCKERGQDFPDFKSELTSDNSQLIHTTCCITSSWISLPRWAGNQVTSSKV